MNKRPETMKELNEELLKIRYELYKELEKAGIATFLQKTIIAEYERRKTA